MTDPWINPDLWNRAVDEEAAAVPDILPRIDHALEAWEAGPDAARWAGAPTEGEWEDKTAAAAIAMMRRCGFDVTPWQGDVIRAIYRGDRIHVLVRDTP